MRRAVITGSAGIGYGTLLCLIVLLSSAPVAAAEPGDVLAQARIETGRLETGRLGAALPKDLVLEDATGRAVALGDLLGGRPALLAPIDYHCRNICGTTLGGLLGALDRLPWRPGKQYDLLIASIDPGSSAADARAARDQYRARLDGLPGEEARFLAGDASALTRVIGFRYGYDAASDQYIHPAAVAVVTPDGRLARWLYGYPFEPSDLRLALVEAGGGTIGTLGDHLWLLCYGYDPTTGQYSAAIGRLVEIGGGLTVLALGGFVVLMLRRERGGR